MKYISQSILYISSLFLAVFFLLTMVFAIEKLEFLIGKTIEWGMGFGGFLILFISMLPSVADLVIPVSVVVATYLIVLAKREQRELLVLASAGSGTRPILSLLVGISVLVTFMSIAVSGYVKPAATFTFRSAYAKAYNELVSQGPQAGRFFEEENRILHVSASQKDDQRRMRVFSFEESRLDQILVSDCSKLHVVEGVLLTNVCEARIYAFQVSEVVGDGVEPDGPVSHDCRLCPDKSGALEVSRIRAGQSSVPLSMRTLFNPVKRNRQGETRLHELLRVGDGQFLEKSNAQFAAIKILLALITIPAISLAVAAVAATNVRTRFFALPAAIALATVFAVAAGSGMLVPSVVQSVTGFAVFFGLVGLACLLSLPLSVFAAGNSLIMPGLVRT